MSQVENAAESLLDVLNRLVAVLEPLQDDDPDGEVEGGAVPRRWESDDYTYVEANLGFGAAPEIDINILGDLVFIRIGR